MGQGISFGILIDFFNSTALFGWHLFCNLLRRPGALFRAYHMIADLHFFLHWLVTSVRYNGRSRLFDVYSSDTFFRVLRPLIRVIHYLVRHVPLIEQTIRAR